MNRYLHSLLDPILRWRHCLKRSPNIAQHHILIFLSCHHRSDSQLTPTTPSSSKSDLPKKQFSVQFIVYPFAKSLRLNPNLPFIHLTSKFSDMNELDLSAKMYEIENTGSSTCVITSLRYATSSELFHARILTSFIENPSHSP